MSGEERAEFECTVKPMGDGRWAVRIREVHGWGSVDVDGALRRWDREKRGGTWTTDRPVGKYRWRWRAVRAANRAVRLARREWDSEECRRVRWLERQARDAITITEAHS